MTQYFGGCDLGSTTGKAVILGPNGMVGSAVIPAMPDPVDTAQTVFALACRSVEGLEDHTGLATVVGTGYGRAEVAFADENLSEITCHAVGVRFLHPEIRTIVDIGGQDVKAIALNEDGSVRDFAMNDKCAAGTGRFLENMARILHVSIEELSDLSLEAKRVVPITSQCSVFAETEVISLLNRRTPRADIAAGLNLSICRRIFGLVRRAGMVEKVTITGGSAKNAGLLKALAETFRVDLAPLQADPQIMGALGAAVLAKERATRKIEPRSTKQKHRFGLGRSKRSVTSTSVAG